MLPDDLAVKDEITRARQGITLRDPVYIILIRDEADLHAVALVRGGQRKFLRQGAHLFFFIAAQRQHQARKLFAFKAAEHIALVVGAPALVERAAPGARVMPGRDALRADAVGLGKQRAEFQRRIAENTGIGRLAAQIALAKGRADLFRQLRLYVQHAQGKTHAHGGVLRLKARFFIRVVEIQGVYLVACLLQQHGGHRGVDPSGKTKNDFFHFPLSK